MIYVGLRKNFGLSDSSELLAIRLVLIRASYWLLSPKMFDSYFLDMIYVEFMKNFLLAYSSELMAVRVISESWGQKRLIPTF